MYENYFKDIQQSFLSWPRTIGRKYLKTHMHPKSLYSILKQLPTHSKVLDVGCGTGNTLYYFNDYRKDLLYFGTDFVVSKIKNHISNFQIIKSDFSGKSPFALGSIDLLTCYFVLEHIETKKIGSFIANLVDVVKPGGYIFMTVPNQYSVLLNFYDDPTHVKPFTSRCLSKLFEPYGIETISSGIDRSLKILLLSPFYQLFSFFNEDQMGVNFFLTHLIGVNTFYLGRKIGGNKKGNQ